MNNWISIIFLKRNCWISVYVYYYLLRVVQNVPSHRDILYSSCKFPFALVCHEKVHKEHDLKKTWPQDALHKVWDIKIHSLGFYFLPSCKAHNKYRNFCHKHTGPIRSFRGMHWCWIVHLNFFCTGYYLTLDLLS